MRSPAVILFAIGLLNTGLHAAEQDIVLIDFENLARGEIVSEQYKSQGVVIRGVNWSHGPDYAVVFDTTDIGDSDDEDLEAPFRPAADLEDAEKLWPGNILILHERHDCEAGFCEVPDDEGSKPAGWLEFEFSAPVTFHRLKLLDINYADGEEPAKFVFFNEAGEVFEELDIPEVARQGSWRPWELNISGVKRARFHLPGDGALDDIEFSHDAVPVNWSPRFESRPPVAVAPDGSFHYLPDVHDLDDDEIIFELLTAPAGMTVAPNGALTWQPDGEEGEHTVSIKAGDGRGGEAVQTFVVHVTDRFARNQGFEFDAGTIVDDELSVDGLIVSTKNLSSGSDYAVVFDTVNPTGGDLDLEAPFREGSALRADLGDAYPGKIIVLHEDHDCDYLETHCLEPNDETTKPAGWIEFRFTQPAHVWSIDVFDVTSDNPEARRIELYDPSGNRFNHELTLPRTGGNKWNRLIIDAQNVIRMRVNLDGDAGLDNLKYALIGSPVSNNRAPIAEPDSYVVAQGETLIVPAPGVLSNDYDPDGDDLTAVLYQSPSNGVLTLNADGSFSYAPQAIFSGQDSFSYRADDREETSLPTTATIDVQASVTPPSIHLYSPAEGVITSNPEIIVAGETDIYAYVTVNGVPASTENDLTFQHLANLEEGENAILVVATALGGASSSVTRTAYLDTVPPPAVDPDHIDIVVESGVIEITGAAGSAESGSTILITNQVSGETVAMPVGPDGGFFVQIAGTSNDGYVIVVVDAAGNASTPVELSPVVDPGIPPDPATIAPPLSQTAFTPFHEATSFLYSGANRIQFDVEPETIEPRRVVVLRGKVMTRDGDPLAGAKVTVNNRPEYGYTVSRADGAYDLAVNGGGYVTVNIEKENFLSSQRTVKTPWRDYVIVENMALVELDPAVTTVDLAALTHIAVAQGSVVQDEDGQRQATILIPPGTSATMTLPDGTQQALSTINVRATEYTVGPSGPTAMPGPLPPTTAYTYAVELSVDEAISAGATRVDFSQPLPFYVDNFLDFPAGTTVPLGWYDRERAAWVPSESGKVVDIVGITADGLAEIDSTGDGAADDVETLSAMHVSDGSLQNSINRACQSGVSGSITSHHGIATGPLVRRMMRNSRHHRKMQRKSRIPMIAIVRKVALLKHSARC